MKTLINTIPSYSNIPAITVAELPTELKAIVDLAVCQGYYHDNHNNEERETKNLGLLTKVIDGEEEQFIVPIHQYCCLNPIKIRHDKTETYLSTWSITGNVMDWNFGDEGVVEPYISPFKYILKQIVA